MELTLWATWPVLRCEAARPPKKRLPERTQPISCALEETVHSASSRHCNTAILLSSNACTCMQCHTCCNQSVYACDEYVANRLLKDKLKVLRSASAPVLPYPSHVGTLASEPSINATSRCFPRLLFRLDILRRNLCQSQLICCLPALRCQEETSDAFHIENISGVFCFCHAIVVLLCFAAL